MTRYRALIVDDSKSARHSLAKLLEAHDLAVEFAVSGEEALEFLRGQLVDVIFMDHTMPGMNGLEAVSAIKSNPRTAMIPVMMYTTKEGEVYVGQARALGAIGVLPKQVQPGVLFDMLLELGLVSDRRTTDQPPPDAPRRRFGDLVEEVDREYEQRALGASVQAVLTRILDAQHQQLRADIQSSQRRFARQVAAEILEQRSTPAEHASSTAAASGSAPGARRLLPAAATLLAVALMALGAVHWHLRTAHATALELLAQQEAVVQSELTQLSDLSGGLAADLAAERRQMQARTAAAAQALEWALALDTRVPFEQPPFNDALADRLPELLRHLRALDFQGQVVLTARLGQFCLVRDDYGQWQPAGDVPVAACELVGHPLEGAVSLGALQTVEFADALQATLADAGGLAVELRAASAAATPAAWPPGGYYLAADWNAAVARANRVDVNLVPREPQNPSTPIARRP